MGTQSFAHPTRIGNFFSRKPLMSQIAEKGLDQTFQASAPVTDHSPELQALLNYIALGAVDRERILFRRLDDDCN
jgi:hypothetical protein